MTDSKESAIKIRPSLAIIIVNWNSYDVTADCLASLRSICYENHQIVVVDNGSTDRSGLRLKAEFPEIILLQNDENLGFTGGNNRGIQHALDANMDLVMLLNNDTIITPEFASILVTSFYSDDETGAVQPKIMFNKEKSVIWNAGSFYNDFWGISKPRGMNEEDRGQYNSPMDLPWVTGCCFLTSADIVREIGLLDQKFFIYYEDTDWSFKIRNKGYRLKYIPESIIFHEVGMSNQNRKGHGEGNVSPFSHYMTVRNHIYLIKRYARGVNRIGAWGNQLAKFIGYFGYFLIRGRFTKLKFVLKGFRDGLRQ